MHLAHAEEASSIEDVINLQFPLFARSALRKPELDVRIFSHDSAISNLSLTAKGETDMLIFRSAQCY